MSEEWEDTHCVTDEMQQAFVEASGDSNPLHTDPIAARRLPFGRVAVHGMHLALDALDRLAARAPRSPQRVECTFRRSVGVGDDLTTRITMTSDRDAHIVVGHDVWRVADLQVQLGPTARPSDTEDPDMVPEMVGVPDPGDPIDLPVSALPAAAGSIDVRADVTVLRQRFPHLVHVAGPSVGAELVSLTRLIGMHVPGLHSLFSSFDVTLQPTAAERRPPGRLQYSVSGFDERFAKATLDVSGRTLRGTAVAFVRPQPVDPTTGDARPRADEFSGQRWLVIGGSRGLGATAAMLVAAGGGDVRLTYHLGVDDAERLAASIGATARHLDVTDPGPGMATILTDGWHPTHLAYFASPPIFDGASGAYSTQLEQRFGSIYIDGFEAVLDRLALARLEGVLWPSTEAVEHDVPGLAEYAAVKRRGEERCAALAREHGHLTVATPRLPRLRTDQTASFLPVDYDDAPTTVLRVLRAFSG